MASGGRIPITANDWMRDMERRIKSLERRPGVPSAATILGNGIGPMATRVVDWNSADILYNGWYFSDSLSVNGPDPDFAWMGMVINTHPGHGIQVLWSHDMVGVEAPVMWKRPFHRHEGQRVAAFESWTDTGGVGTGPAGPTGATGATGPAGAPGITVVQHGTVGSTARPSVPLVYWVGSATPANGLPYDLWLEG